MDMMVYSSKHNGDNSSHALTTGDAVPQNKRSKRRLSVSIVESEGLRNSGNANDVRTNSNTIDRHLTESMTQDCIEWDEGRNNVDLRKLADPNFQTPSTVLFGTTNPLPSNEDTSTSPKGRTLSLCSTTGSRSDSRSPVPRRRQRRRKESLDLVTRDISVSDKENDVSNVIASTNMKTISIVTTDRHLKRRNQNVEDQPGHENGDRLPFHGISAATNMLPLPTKNDVRSSVSVCATTGFTDLLHKLQSNGVTTSVSTSNNKTNERPHSANQSSEARSSINHPISTTAQQESVAKRYNQSNLISTVHGTDEFDDADFSLDDIAVIDSLVQSIPPKEAGIVGGIRTPKEHTNIAGSAKNSTDVIDQPELSITKMALNTVQMVDDDVDPFGEIPDIDIDALVEANNITAATNQSPPQDSYIGKLLHPTMKATSPSSEDPFSDLPDFDIDAFIKEQDFIRPTTSSTAKTTNDSVANKDEFQDIDFELLDMDSSNIPKMEDAPPTNVPVKNLRRYDPKMGETQSTHIVSSRYKVLDVSENFSTYTKKLSLAEWTTDMVRDDDQHSRLIHHPSDYKIINRLSSNRDKSKIAGVIYLRGEWYHTRLQANDTIHIVSLMGRFRTDKLPILFHTCPPPNSDTDDDLLLIVHPDLLLTPTIISETVSCTRRAVLKNRLGATTLSCKWHQKSSYFVSLIIKFV
jgi:DNA replication factor Dna2